MVGLVADAPTAHSHQVSSRVFRTQTLCAASVLTVVAVIFAVAGSQFDSTTAFIGLFIMLLASVISALVQWESLQGCWSMSLPLLDVVAILFLRDSAPTAGFGTLLVFPIIWMASSFGRCGAIVGSAATTIGLWIASSPDLAVVFGGDVSTQQLSSLAALPLMIIFTASTVHMSTARFAAQRVLLQGQTLRLKETVARVRQEEDRLREILDAVDFSVVLADLDGNILLGNRAMYSMGNQVGLPPAGTLNHLPAYAEDRVTPIAEEDLPYARAARGEPVESQIMWLGHPGDARIALSITARKLYAPNGSFDSIVTVARDYTPEARAIEERDDLVASVSHELRTPLTSILGYLDLALDDTTLNEETREHLDVALNGAERMKVLVSDLLAAHSENSSTELEFTMENFDLVAIVAQSLEAARPGAADRMISMVSDPLPETTVHGDPFRLRQVFDNIASNAVKYSEFGDRIVTRLEHAVNAEGDPIVTITIADNGRGMTEEEQKGLFQRFYRADSVRRSAIHGTGLGLSISRDIVEKHQGSIEITSEAGVGTTVTVTLPRIEGKRDES